jgi:hypothetical protein
MPRWLADVLGKVRALARQRAIRFTKKAADELGGLEFGLDFEDACRILEELKTEDWAQRLRSELTSEWMYVFKPSVAGDALYVKVILREECVVVSFHLEDEDE